LIGAHRPNGIGIHLAHTVQRVPDIDTLTTMGPDEGIVPTWVTVTPKNIVPELPAYRMETEMAPPLAA